jgi:5,6-dimethylbenzimidazole synthase
VEDEFSAGDREVLYRVIKRRRDVRAFRPDPIPSETLYRILSAAHHAPSVGLMQPWNFIVIQDAGTKARIKEIFLRENEKAAAHYSGPRGMLYRSLKLEGIEEAPVNLCVTADRTRAGRMCSGATPSWTLISTAPAARSRTCGSPREWRELGSAG